MASPLARASAIDLLEEAVHTLRAAPLATLVSHWTGSVPFALGLLIFWNDMTSPGARDATCAPEALALALLLAWMNCWRAVFAGRIQRQLGRRPQPPWTRTRVWRLIASQVFLGATKLAALPLAITITLPMPSTVAFYRNAAVLADREDLDLRQLMAKARNLAATDQRQGWGILLLLTVLYLVLVVNLAILLAVLPQLIRILTGYESVFSRGGPYFVRSSLFWLATLALAWMAFDPFIQTVYCIRYFKLESRETGEDLRAALRAAMGESMRLILFLAMTSMLAWGFAAGQPAQLSPADLDRAIHQTLRSSDYAWRSAPAVPRQANGVPWLVAVTNRFVDHVKAALRSVGDAIDRWLRDRLSAPSGIEPGAPPATALHLSIYALIALMLALAAAIAWRMRHARNAKPVQIAAATGALVNLRDENVLASQLPEDRWMALAEDCARQGDLRSALRALYLANLAWLGSGAWIAIHPGKTNREYELEVRRKARSFPEACSLLAANIASFEAAWYGMHEVTAGDLELLRQRLQRMKTVIAPAELAA
jgi:Domain of unknown function (DUF4129)